MKAGDKIVVVDGDFTDPSTLREMTVKSHLAEREFLTTLESKYPLNVMYCFPIAAKEELSNIMDKRGALKKAYDDSMGLIYKLRNEYRSK